MENTSSSHKVTSVLTGILFVNQKESLAYDYQEKDHTKSLVNSNVKSLLAQASPIKHYHYILKAF